MAGTHVYLQERGTYWTQCTAFGSNGLWKRLDGCLLVRSRSLSLRGLTGLYSSQRELQQENSGSSSILSHIQCLQRINRFSEPCHRVMVLCYKLANYIRRKPVSYTSGERVCGRDAILGDSEISNRVRTIREMRILRNVRALRRAERGPKERRQSLALSC